MRLSHESGVEFVAFFAAVQSNFGFVFANFAGERFRSAATDVRRITQDQIKADGSEGRKKVGLNKTNTVRETKAPGIATGYGQSNGGNVRGIDSSLIKLPGERNGDAT